GTASLSVGAGPLDHLALDPSSSSLKAGEAQTYTATGFDQYGNSLGDVTAQTAFTVSPDGSCSGAACGSTTAGAHTVTGADGTAIGTASLSVTAAALDHLALTPSSSSLKAGESQTYTATGFDQYGNSLGDVTAQTTFTVSPDGSCSGAACG